MLEASLSNRPTGDTQNGLEPVRKKTGCSYEPCEKSAEALGLCMGHYQQQYRGAALTPLRSNQHLRRDDQGKVCSACRDYKEWDNYYGKSRSMCKPCLSRYNTKVNQARQARGRVA